MTEDEILDNLNECQTEEERFMLEKDLDIVRRIKENNEKEHKESEFDFINDFDYYPDFNDHSFNQNIYNKKEFRDHRMIKRDASKLSKTSVINELIFRRTPSQNFTANYISTYTPYNGILLWHGVGIGKTCTALSIAENFKDYILLHGKKIIILTPSDTLRETWRNEIFNIDKEINKHRARMNSNVQCTGDRYTREIFVDWDELADPKKTPAQKLELYKKAKKSVNTIINKHYKILGYQMMVNEIKKKMKQKNIINGPEYKKIEFIRNEFSNTVIIMDEAHFIRDDTDDGDANRKDVKLATPYIDLIARYAENSKIILSTATPMYNKSNEIIGLLNILLLNDKRSPLEENNIFTKDGKFVDNNSRKLLLDKAQGYISYVRSENPFDFPIKLEPTGSNVYTPNPNKEWNDDTKIITGSRIKDIKFFKSPMSKYQYSVYRTFALKQDRGPSFEIKPKQASNIVFPRINKDDTVYIGNKAFKKCFELIKDKDIKKYEYTREYLENIQFSFLHSDKIGIYSSKFKNILDSIKSCVGIVFVYSQYIETGIRALSLVLEENGFMNYEGNNKFSHLLNTTNTRNTDNDFCARHLKKRSELTEEQLGRFKQATYIYLDGEVNNMNDLLRDCNNPINKDGHKIKVILGSRVTGQGLNFKNVREVHITDPWFHFNSLEQSIGRAIRRGSHNDLPVEHRNATIYIHIASLTEDPQSTYYEKDNITNRLEMSDEHDYRVSYRKAEAMAEVQRLLKENAIDCENNIDGNLYLKKDYENMDRDIVDSKGNKRRIHIYDKDGSLLCDLRKCEMTCRSKNNNVTRDMNIDINTFDIKHQESKKVIFKEIIKQIFIKDMNYDENTIINEIMTVAQDMGFIAPNISKKDRDLNKNIIWKCLTEMIKNKEYVYNYEFRPGIIEVFKGSYIFTPVELMNVNKYVPLLNRNFPNMELIPREEEKRNILCTKPSQVITEEKKEKEFEEKKESFIKDDNKDLDKLNKLLKDATDFVNLSLKHYPDVDDEKRDLPVKSDMIKYKFQSLFEKNYANNMDDKYDILENILKKVLLKRTLTDVEKYILNLYDTPNKNTYVIRDKNKQIIGYKRVYIKTITTTAKPTYDIIQNIYIWDNKSSFYISNYEADIINYKWNKILNEVTNSSEVRYIGWLGKKKTDGSVEFIMTEIKKTDEVENKKKQLKGSMCKTSVGVLKDRTELKDVMERISGRSLNREGQKDITREYLCYEFELLLRHLDNKNGSLTKRHFYRMEEKEYMDNIK
jgi:hypothetical protein